MQLIRYGEPGHERLAAVTSGDRVIDLAERFGDLDDVLAIGRGLDPIAEFLANGADETKAVPLGGVRLGPPIPRPHQILCIGLNFSDHARESGMDAPAEPIIFNKAPNTLVGPDDAILLPRAHEKVDWEVELGVVIGRRTRYLSGPEDSSEHIAGYVVVNDVSERVFQLERGGQWVKGKSCETFNPCGPRLITADELSDLNRLAMRLWVNGELLQDGTTADMIFGVDHLVWYLSQFMVLEPGDLINTGTPAGVGLGQDPPRFLADGDLVEVEIEGLGRQRQRVATA